MHYINKHTPFDGRTFKGAIEKVFVRGTLVCDERQLKTEPGTGRFYKMAMK
jgi:dihydroorotase-like cyclic amidohydrolase